jgi:hypothetical protein
LNRHPVAAVLEETMRASLKVTFESALAIALLRPPESSGFDLTHKTLALRERLLEKGVHAARRIFIQHHNMWTSMVCPTIW